MNQKYTFNSIGGNPNFTSGNPKFTSGNPNLMGENFMDVILIIILILIVWKTLYNTFYTKNPFNDPWVVCGYIIIFLWLSSYFIKM